MAPSKYNGMSNFSPTKKQKQNKINKNEYTIVLILSKGEKDGQIT